MLTTENSIRRPLRMRRGTRSTPWFQVFLFFGFRPRLLLGCHRWRRYAQDSISCRNRRFIPRAQKIYSSARPEEWIMAQDKVKKCPNCLLGQYNFIATRAAGRVDIHKFFVPWFQYLRMPMGLCNSLSTFQRLMEACFAEKFFEILLIYLDDLLIYSRTVEEHIERLNFVFKRLKEHGLKLKPKKCHIFQKQIG